MMVIPRICGLYGINLFGYNSLNMLTSAVLLFNTLRAISEFFSLQDVTLRKLRSHRSSGAFLPSLFYLLVFFPDILQSFPENRERQRKFLECLLFRDQSDAR